MRLHLPSLSLSATQAVVTAVLEPDDPDRRSMEVWWSADRALVGWLDLTPTPFVPVAAITALVLGEPLTIAGPVSERLTAGANLAVERLAGWLDLPPVAIDGGPGAPGGADAGSAPGVGLFFTRGVDSWSSLLHHRHEITHLIGLDDLEPGQSESNLAEVWAGHEQAAAMVGLPLVRLTTNVRSILDSLCSWEWTHGAALASAGLLLSPVLGRILIAGSYPEALDLPWGSHHDLDPRWSTDSTEIVHDGADISRWDKTAAIAAEPAVVATLRVCWQPAPSPNCGRCEKCLRTMTTLASLGALDPTQFGGPLQPDAIRELSLVSGTQRAFVEELVARLEPGDPLRNAWASILPEAGPRVLVDTGCTPMTGPDVHDRLAPTLARLGWVPEPMVAGTGPAAGDGMPRSGTVLDVGWGEGQVPLRPSSVDAATIVERWTGTGDRPELWVVAEPHDPQGIGAAEQTHLVALLTSVWGRGLTYLPGLGWVPDQPPALGPDVVARLLLGARVRAWWRNDGPLDALRLVESLEHGCLPLQVMPPGPAVTARRQLPTELAALVVDEAEIWTLDRNGLDRRRDDAAATVLTGSVERDLALHLGVAPAGAHS